MILHLAREGLNELLKSHRRNKERERVKESVKENKEMEDSVKRKRE